MTTYYEWNPKQPEMPVDKDGNWISFMGYNQAGFETIYQPFPAVMKIDGLVTGRSSKVVVLKDESGKKYPMFVSDLIEGIGSGSFEVKQTETGGQLIGHWTGSKRGQNFGVKAVRVD